MSIRKRIQYELLSADQPLREHLKQIAQMWDQAVEDALEAGNERLAQEARKKAYEIRLQAVGMSFAEGIVALFSEGATRSLYIKGLPGVLEVEEGRLTFRDHQYRRVDPALVLTVELMSQCGWRLAVKGD